MILTRIRLRPLSSPCRVPAKHIPSRSLTTRSDPLRILFCGADEFSCAALEALDGERRAGGVVESLDVVVRPGKGVGRGYKTIREVPLKHVASKLQLPIHERDTFTGFELPNYINLVVAVSFGLFVPSRILQGAKYGGLNVHPSFLPDLRGAAPLHHALLQDRAHTGITLQTLDERKFDHGLILSQTPRPGIPIPPSCTVPQLAELVRAPAAELLLDGLRRGLHVDPVDIRGEVGEAEASRAPKVTKGERRVQWGAGAEEIVRRLRVLGPLWGEVAGKKGAERVIVRDAEAVEEPVDCEWKEVEFLEESGQGGELRPVRIRYCAEGDGAAVVALPAGGALRIGEIVVGGKGVRRAAVALAPFSV